MNVKIANHQLGHYTDYTNGTGASIAGGQPIDLGGRVGISAEVIADGADSALQVAGVVKARNAAVVGSKGDNVWWDADGTPVSGTASSGAVTTVASDGDIWLGTLDQALAITDTLAYIRLNEANPGKPSWLNRTHETKSADYTVDAQDSGKVLWVDTDAKVITLPATAAGLDIIIANAGADGTVLVTISPNASDKIMGPDLAGTDDTDRLNTKATANRGDYVHLRGDGSAGWWIIEQRGTWADAA